MEEGTHDALPATLPIVLPVAWWLMLLVARVLTLYNLSTYNQYLMDESLMNAQEVSVEERMLRKLKISRRRLPSVSSIEKIHSI